MARNSKKRRGGAEDGANDQIAAWRRLPREPRGLAAWLLWKRGPLKPNGKFDKVPHRADGKKRFGANGSAVDRRGLATFDTVAERYRANNSFTKEGGYDGIALALLPDIPLWALDLDDCIGEGGLSALAQRVARSGTYCERSPSGRGVRALYAGKAGADAKAAGVELFDSRGQVTLTGDWLAGRALKPCPPALLKELLKTAGGGAKKPCSSDDPAPWPPNPRLLRGVELPAYVRLGLAGAYQGCNNRSNKAFSFALDLRRVGLTKEQALETMSAPELLEPALERRGNLRGARDWMWRYVVRPAYEAAP